jgi:hypothetical protein
MPYFSPEMKGMDDLTDNVVLHYEKLEYDDRYYVQTAKNSIESLAHIVAEAGSNEDEAISHRATRDGGHDEGWIDFRYDPDTEILSVTGDGAGMTAAVMWERLRRVGVEAQENARRGFFHRGIREVFIAMGGGRVTSIGKLDDGHDVLSQAVFDPHKGMAISIEDEQPTPEWRTELGLTGTGTRVEIPMKRFVRDRPGQFAFPKMEQQIRDCVGIRPVLSDDRRAVHLTYADEPPRSLRFEYPNGEDLVVAQEATICGQRVTFWAKVSDKPPKGGLRGGKQMRRSGVLIRGERAAYEVSSGEKIAAHPAMPRVFGELRMDAIEQIQRDADRDADQQPQLVYKADRSGLNPEHPVSVAIYRFIDETLAPLIANLDAGEQQKQITGDMRRQLAKLARAINQVIKAEIQTITDPTADKTKYPVDKEKVERDPPQRSREIERYVENGIGFAHSRIFIDAAQSRTVEVWFDSDVIGEGTSVTLRSPKTLEVPAISLARDTVPQSGKDSIAAIDLTVHAGNTEGRHELAVTAGEYEATLVVHVRFPRAAGFISNIVPVDEDWTLGSALYDPSSGVVKVFVGRPEFKDAAARAKREGENDPWKNRVYRTLVVESVREAALWEAAKLQADVEWDEMSYEERQGEAARTNLVRTMYQELDYRLRAKLLQVFGEI